MNDITNKAKPAIEATVSRSAEDGKENGVVLTFAHGRVLTVGLDALTPEIQRAAMLHGLKQKLVDAAAISRDTATGKAATIETKYDAVREVYDRLMAGEWNKKREGGGATSGLLKRALVEMYAGRKTAEQIDAWLATKDDKAKAALRKEEKVAAIIERMRAETAKTGDSAPAADLLAELDGMDDGEEVAE